MPLRKSPLRTPALLAANRANAQSSTGPRSPQGKARVALNTLQHGRYAVRLREKLAQAGEGSAESQYQWFRSEIAAAFGASGRDDELQAEQMAARAWCAAREAMCLGTKPECALESVAKEAWYTSLLRIRIDDRLAADWAGVLGAAAQVLDPGARLGDPAGRKGVGLSARGSATRAAMAPAAVPAPQAEFVGAAGTGGGNPKAATVAPTCRLGQQLFVVKWGTNRRPPKQVCYSLVGHSDVKTTMIYAHVLNRGPTGVCSPVNGLAEHRGGFRADPYKTPRASFRGSGL